MKKTNILLSALLLGGMALTSCHEDPDMAPVTFPEGVTVPEGESPDAILGTGTWDDPYHVWQVGAGVEIITDDVNWGWVHGYIVGYIDTSLGISRYCEKTAVLHKTGSVQSNILIADDPNETDWEKCVPVNFEYDYPAREALKLNTNPQALGREVCIFGVTGFKYRTVYGLKYAVYYKWGALGDPNVIPPDIFDRAQSYEDSADDTDMAE